MQKKYILAGIVGNILFTSLLFGYLQHQRGSLAIGSSKNIQQSLIQSLATARTAVVGVFSEQENAYALEDKQGANQGIKKINQRYIEGSAFFIDSQGYLLTSKHVVQNAPYIYSVVLEDGRTFPVQKIWKHPNLDLAILYIGQNKNQTSFSVVNFIDQQTILPIGQFAFTIGTPFSQYSNTASFGIVSGIGRELSLDGGTTYTGLYQLDINTNPGNSGGPVITYDGKVFGLVTAMASQNSHIGFALPLSQKFILELLTNIKSFDSLGGAPK